MRKIILSLILVTLLMMVGASAINDLEIVSANKDGSIIIKNQGDTAINLSKIIVQSYLSDNTIIPVDKFPHHITNPAGGRIATYSGISSLNPGQSMTSRFFGSAGGEYQYLMVQLHSYIILQDPDNASNAINGGIIYPETNYNNNFIFLDYGILPQPSCSDSLKNQDETDIDCGGDICNKCDLDSTCSVNDDCISNNCLNNVCTAQVIPNCNDGIKNGPETDIDCGDYCEKCSNDKVCLVDDDCISNYCDSGVCKTNPYVEPKSNWWIWLLLIIVIALIGTGIYYLTRKKGKSRKCRFGKSKTSGRCLKNRRKR